MPRGPRRSDERPDLDRRGKFPIGAGASPKEGVFVSTGLIALLDDVVGLAKVAAASLDDAAAQATRAGAKAAGVVIDDAAVTPRYVVGFAASRELPSAAGSRSAP